MADSSIFMIEATVEGKTFLLQENETWGDSWINRNRAPVFCSPCAQGSVDRSPDRVSFAREGRRVEEDVNKSIVGVISYNKVEVCCGCDTTLQG